MTLSVQFLTLITMIVSGIGFGAVLDTYNYFLNRKNRKRWLVFIHDIVFWIVVSLTIFYVLFLVNNGEIRFYIFLSLLCGFSAYQALVKNFYMKCLQLLIRITLWVIRMVKRLVYLFIALPIKWLLQLTKSIFILVKKILITLLKGVFLCIRWLLLIIFSPLGWIFKLIWSFMPKPLKNTVDKYYTIFKGFIIKTKNLIINKYKNLTTNKKVDD